MQKNSFTAWSSFWIRTNGFSNFVFKDTGNGDRILSKGQKEIRIVLEVLIKSAFMGACAHTSGITAHTVF